MLLTVAIVLLVVALVGGITVHPVLFLLVLLALLAFAGSRRAGV